MTTDYRVDVVDQLNNLRLLGSILKPRPQLREPYYQLHVMPYVRASVAAFDPSVVPMSIVNVSTIHMTIVWITSEDTWSKRAAFATSNSLKELMMINDFRLPGESDEAAYHRSWMQ